MGAPIPGWSGPRIEDAAEIVITILLVCFQDVPGRFIASARGNIRERDRDRDRRDALFDILDRRRGNGH
jgi:hypothetical protein